LAASITSHTSISHGGVDYLQFVDESNVDSSENVLGKLYASAVAVEETGTVLVTSWL
jgi:hypothetical protein